MVAERVGFQIAQDSLEIAQVEYPNVTDCSVISDRSIVSPYGQWPRDPNRLQPEHLDEDRPYNRQPTVGEPIT